MVLNLILIMESLENLIEVMDCLSSDGRAHLGHGTFVQTISEVS